MIWITYLFVAFWDIANDYAWLATDPTANFALKQANCLLPTPDCLRQAKMAQKELYQKHIDAYWYGVEEELARVEYEKQAKEVHDRYIAQQLAKGDKWDRWEVSPPTITMNTIVNNFINPTLIAPTLISPTLISPTLISPTLVSIHTALPEIPRQDIMTLAGRYRPSSKENLTIGEHAFGKSAIEIWAKDLAILFISIYVIYKTVSCFVNRVQWAFKKFSCPRLCSTSQPQPPSPPPPPHSNLFRTPLGRQPPIMPSTSTSTSKKPSLHYAKTQSTQGSRADSWPPRRGLYSPITESFVPASAPAATSPATTSGTAAPNLQAVDEAEARQMSTTEAEPNSSPRPPLPSSPPPLPPLSSPCAVLRSLPTLAPSIPSPEAPEKPLESTSAAIEEFKPHPPAAELSAVEQVPDNFDLDLEDNLIAAFESGLDHEPAPIPGVEAEARPEMEAEVKVEEQAAPRKIAPMRRS